MRTWRISCHHLQAWAGHIVSAGRLQRVLSNLVTLSQTVREAIQVLKTTPNPGALPSIVGCWVVSSVLQVLSIENVSKSVHIFWNYHAYNKNLTSLAGGRRNMPAPASLPLTFWTWKWCSSHVWRGLPLCHFFSLPRPLCSRHTPDLRDRQTSDAHHRLIPLPRGGGIINTETLVTAYNLRI